MRFSAPPKNAQNMRIFQQPALARTESRSRWLHFWAQHLILSITIFFSFFEKKKLFRLFWPLIKNALQKFSFWSKSTLKYPLFWAKVIKNNFLWIIGVCVFRRGHQKKFFFVEKKSIWKCENSSKKRENSPIFMFWFLWPGYWPLKIALGCLGRHRKTYSC